MDLNKAENLKKKKKKDSIIWCELESNFQKIISASPLTVKSRCFA